MSTMRTEQVSDEYVVHLDVPAVAGKDVDFELADSVVTVRFELPDDADTGHVTTTYAHGAFELHAPRRRHRFTINADASGV